MKKKRVDRYCEVCRKTTKWLLEFVGVWERHTCTKCNQTKVYKTK